MNELANDYYKTKMNNQVIDILSKRNITQRSVDKRVKRILDDVKKTGDLAVRKYTAQFDKHKINSNDLRISKSRIKSAYKYIDKELVKSLRLSAKRIEIFHKKQIPKNSNITGSR